MLASAAPSDFEGADGELLLRPEPFDRVNRHVRGVPLPQEAPWPREWLLPASSAAVALPVPASTVFELPELPRPTPEAVARLAPRAKPVVVAEREPPEAIAARVGNSPRALRGKNRIGHGKQLNASHKGRRGTAVAAHKGPNVVHARRGGSPKHLAQVKKRNV